jgi:hypothetical protein
MNQWMQFKLIYFFSINLNIIDKTHFTSIFSLLLVIIKFHKIINYKTIKFQDVFSKVASAVPLKTKSAVEVAAALDKIISNMPITPRKLMVDAGGEFSGSSSPIYNVIVRKYKMMIFVLTDSETKAAIVERFNRTLRDRLARFMTENKTKRWVDYLPEAISNYNNSIHRSIGMAPNSVSFENKEKVFKKLFPGKNLKVKCKIKIGWKARVPLKKTIFDKGFKPNWSDEIYEIVKVEQVCSIQTNIWQKMFV